MPRRPRRGTFRAAACHCCRGLGLTTHSFSLCASVNSGMKKFQAGWNDFSSNPKYWLSTLSVVNVAVIGAASYFGYRNRNEIQKWDRRLLSAVIVGAATFFGAEGFVYHGCVRIR